MCPPSSKRGSKPLHAYTSKHTTKLECSSISFTRPILACCCEHWSHPPLCRHTFVWFVKQSAAGARTLDCRDTASPEHRRRPCLGHGRSGEVQRGDAHGTLG